MSPFPVKELEASQFDEAYAEANGPFTVVTPQSTEYTVFRNSDIWADDQEPSPEAVSAMEEGYQEALRGQGISADALVATLRDQYGF